MDHDDDDRPPETPPATDPDRPLDRVADHWEAVVEDMEATADRYREAGADVVELHPGDVVARPDVGGFDVLVPDAEFEALRDLVADTQLPETEVFRAEAADVAFFVAMLATADGSAAVCCPLYYHTTDEDVATVRRQSEEAGALRTLVRPLENDQAVVLQFDDPDLFFEGGDADSDDSSPAGSTTGESTAEDDSPSGDETP